ncbi:MAG: hypothetical protein LBI02_10375, partial [Opitutaceae bacterium]|nr:hypothetical protein [Opitutaceae bacterium]
MNHAPALLTLAATLALAFALSAGGTAAAASSAAAPSVTEQKLASNVATLVQRGVIPEADAAWWV